MSRTERGNRPMGFEYWSRRNHKSSIAGPDAKSLSNRHERRAWNKVIRNELGNEIEETDEPQSCVWQQLDESDEFWTMLNAVNGGHVEETTLPDGTTVYRTPAPISKDEWIQKAKALFYDALSCVDSDGIAQEMQILIAQGGGYDPIRRGDGPGTELVWRS